MGALNLALWAVGVVLIAFGAIRIRRPWGRYQQLKAQEENIARYEGWRGSRLRDDGPTAASVMMAESRRQARIAGLIAVAGVVLVFLGFALK